MERDTFSTKEEMELFIRTYDIGGVSRQEQADGTWVLTYYWER